MLDKMSDIVWSLNVENDSFEQLMGKLRSYALTMTNAKNIAFQFYIDPGIQGRRLDIKLRKNIYMITKEAINNAIKYADCSAIGVILSSKPKGAELTITDNGKGFNKDMVNKGNGLSNMQKRAKEMRGSFEIDTARGEGTRIRVRFNFT